MPEPAVTDAMLERPGLGRLIIAMIEAFQAELVRRGKLAETSLIPARIAERAPGTAEDLVIGEADLGLDSLDRLELVRRMTCAFGLDATGIEDYLLIRRRLGDWIDLIRVHFEKVGPEAVIAFPTSGSTGTPRHANHRRNLLESEVATLRQIPGLARAEGRRVLALVPPHHIYGFLWTVLLPLRSGWEVVDLSRSGPGALFRRAAPGDVVIATPFLWDMIAGTGQTLAADVLGVSSGAPATGHTWAAARRAGLSRLIEIYGATETGGIGWRDAEHAAFALLGDLERRNGALWRLGTPLEVQDRLDWTAERAFRVLGRRDRVIQVAGVNVNLETLRQRLLDATGADDAAVRLADDRLKAFIVVPRRREALARNAVHALLDRLPAPERPVEISFGPTLPRSRMGKISAW